MKKLFISLVAFAMVFALLTACHTAPKPQPQSKQVTIKLHNSSGSIVKWHLNSSNENIEISQGFWKKDFTLQKGEKLHFAYTAKERQMVPRLEIIEGSTKTFDDQIENFEKTFLN